MSTDCFHCLDATTLLRWMLHDLDRGTLFGIDTSLFFTPKPHDPFRMERYGRILETPFGVAAGPHTQLAQNILSAWICGARYIELKTIQVLDELTVTKPCIDMADEGYNCEWSQELKLDQSYNEYLKAFVLLYVLRDKLGLPAEVEPGKGPGFLFNMSAGYNLEGIQSPTVQRFFDRMEHCAEDIAKLKQELSSLYPRILDLPIPDRMSDNLTVSTMHGCPPDEVEKIGLYFIQERKYHTTIKLNPTLLGSERLRDILNNRLGFEVTVPDEAFGHDLKYPDGVALIRNLRAAASEAGVCFSLKLTNTLETANKYQNLPKHEAMVYMSGRALHPISINLAARLQQEFAGALDISFSAGVDVFNAADVLACGLRPVTVCSDILKPGGYGRISQYLDMVGMALRKAKASSLADWSQSAQDHLEHYAAAILHKDSRYRKDAPAPQSIKIDRPLPRFDCAKAPCMAACPTEQDIPRYLEATARGDFDLAWKIILATNPFPNVQGMVCNHRCQSQCTRQNYDSPLLIREIKRFIAQKHKDSGTGLTSAPSCGKKVSIIGAGPSGLSCAHFLALQGVEVDVYEAKGIPGGMAADAIPAFRLDEESLDRDIRAILDLGVRLHTNARVDADLFTQVKESSDAVYLAVGAQQNQCLGIPGEQDAGIMDQLTFLSQVRQGKKPELGKRVIVVGAGNSAMDTARTALRLVAPDGEVTIVYRRTCKEMPADPQEVREALDEGVRLLELCGPKEVLCKDGKVTGLRVDCMKLVHNDQGGRPCPVSTGESKDLEADSILVAIGQEVVADFLCGCGGRLKTNPRTRKTSMEGVFAGGDAVRGASSLINAIGDGRKGAEAILSYLGLPICGSSAPCDDRKPDLRLLNQRRGKRFYGPRPEERKPTERLDFDLVFPTLSDAEAKQESKRCLQCDQVCNICTTVCPNRANMALRTSVFQYPVQLARQTPEGVRIQTLTTCQITQPWQIINIADNCNECGNCTTFCPSSGAPYRDKPKLHLSQASFDAANDGYRLTSTGVQGKHDGSLATLTDNGTTLTYVDSSMTATLDPVTLNAQSVVLAVPEGSLSCAVEMAIVYRLLSAGPFVQ